MPSDNNHDEKQKRLEGRKPTAPNHATPSRRHRPVPHPSILRGNPRRNLVGTRLAMRERGDEFAFGLPGPRWVLLFMAGEGGIRARGPSRSEVGRGAFRGDGADFRGKPQGVATRKGAFVQAPGPHSARIQKGWSGLTRLPGPQLA